MSHANGAKRALSFGASRDLQAPPFAPRALCRAIRIACALGTAAASIPAMADCGFTGSEILAPTTNTGDCSVTSRLLVAAPLSNEGTISVLDGVRLDNKSTILNSGLIATSGQFSGGGTLTNTGSLHIDAGGSAVIAQSTNLNKGTLTGGTWALQAGDKLSTAATLDFESGSIQTNAASILLSGAATFFADIDQLSRNEGSLIVQNGRTYEVVTPLVNTGVLGAHAGGTLTNTAGIENTGTIEIHGGALNGKGQLDNRGTLSVFDSTVVLANSKAFDALKSTLVSGGRWIVESSDTGVASLRIGQGEIKTNFADIALIGAGARLEGLASLRDNAGKLLIERHDLLLRADDDGNETSLFFNAASGSIEIGEHGTLQVIGAKNDGSLTIHGELRAQSLTSEKAGTFDNRGVLRLEGAPDGTKSHIHRSGNFVVDDTTESATLTGGTWHLVGANSVLEFRDSENIQTNAANVILDGEGATFGQLTRHLVRNEGSLTFAGRRTDTLAGKFLRNEGSLTVQDSRLTVTDSGDLISGKAGVTLAGGSWTIAANFGSEAELVLQSAGKASQIHTNAAQVTLRGSGARFAQLDTLELNTGTLRIEDGKTFSALSKSFDNEGSLIIGAGGQFLSKGQVLNTGTLEVSGEFNSNLTNSGTVIVAGDLIAGRSGNLDSSSKLGQALKGGRWRVVDDGVSAGALTLGTGDIVINEADVELAGPNVRFTQLDRLERNLGSLSLGGTRFQINAAKFRNEGTLAVAADAILHSRFGFTNTGLLAIDGLLEGDGRLTNEGVVRVTDSTVQLANVRELDRGVLAGGTWEVVATGASPGASLTLESGDIIDNQASVRLSGQHARFAQLDRLQTNGGSLVFEHDSRYTIDAPLHNTGTLIVRDGAHVNGKNSLVNSGVLDIDLTSALTGGGSLLIDGGLVRVDGKLAKSSVLMRGGELVGSGTIEADVLIEGGTLNPGNSPGILHIDGDYMMSGGALRIEVAGLAEGEFDRLLIGGNALFTHGALVFDFDSWTAPRPDSLTIDFLDARSITGLELLDISFLGLQPGFEFALDAGRGALSLSKLNPSPVPVPAAAWLFATGLAMLTARRRVARR